MMAMQKGYGEVSQLYKKGRFFETKARSYYVKEVFCLL